MFIDIAAGIVALVIIAAAYVFDYKHHEHITGGQDRKSVITCYVSKRSNIILTKNRLRRFMDKRFKILPQDKVPSRADIVLGLSQGIERELFSTKAHIRYRTNPRAVTDKVALYHLAAAAGLERHFAKTYELRPSGIGADMQAKMTLGAVTYTPEEIVSTGPGPWIIRANFGWGGAANAVVTSVDEMRERVDYFFNEGFSTIRVEMRNMERPPRVIASEYIVSPMLIRGYKFHVRFNVIVVLGPTRRYAAMLPTALVVSSADKYSATDYTNMRLHDTHMGTAAFKRALPAGVASSDTPTAAELELGNKMISNTLAAFKELFPVLLPEFVTFPEAEVVYDFLGIDVMFLPDATPVILEINGMPNILDEYVDEFLGAVFATVIADEFGYKTKNSTPVIMI